MRFRESILPGDSVSLEYRASDPQAAGGLLSGRNAGQFCDRSPAHSCHAVVAFEADRRTRGIGRQRPVRPHQQACAFDRGWLQIAADGCQDAGTSGFDPCGSARHVDLDRRLPVRYQRTGGADVACHGSWPECAGSTRSWFCSPMSTLPGVSSARLSEENSTSPSCRVLRTTRTSRCARFVRCNSHGLRHPRASARERSSQPRSSSAIR